jgi:hypothetical protein
MALWTLKALDMHELVETGAIEDRDYKTWDEFKADPFNWFIMHPTKAPAVWKAIWMHQPKSKPSKQSRDNVVELGDRRGGKRGS